MKRTTAVTSANALVSINAKTMADLRKYESLTGESIHDVIETALTDWLQTVAPVRVSLITRLSHGEIPKVAGWRETLHRRVTRK